jgi:hypothetical protein
MVKVNTSLDNSSCGLNLIDSYPKMLFVSVSLRHPRMISSLDNYRNLQQCGSIRHHWCCRSSFVQTVEGVTGPHAGPNHKREHLMVPKSTIPKSTGHLPSVCDFGFTHLVVRSGIYPFFGMVLFRFVLFGTLLCNHHEKD